MRTIITGMPLEELSSSSTRTTTAYLKIGALVTSWWDEIDESTQWQDGIFFSLCAAYALVSSVALIQLIRIELRVPEYGWTTQKVFHLMNFIVNGVRAIVFGFHKQVFLLYPKTVGTDVNNIGSSGTTVFLYIHTTCPLLGRDISSGKQEVYQQINSGFYISQSMVQYTLYRCGPFHIPLFSFSPSVLELHSIYNKIGDSWD
ncbi:hypothetical protein JRO89_XS06G0182000 [Xanthoceras sorbifolium]|uniref:THH1/TOM1/TOM3 domain-containing protein n=1 Tax=Xanthoceras sorbifolium TaxID=99658 RepID=A0ABQ8HZ12_9ROSI|nr:hypothetical protein JRO89_XS06G0182000 [Xanthoceras sorbifolium]